MNWMRSSARQRAMAMPAMWIAISSNRDSTEVGARTVREYMANTPSVSPPTERIGVDQQER